MGKLTFLQDFKAFAMKGNVIDMAVGVIIGGAFGKIVSSLVADVIMPPVGLLVGGVNFTDLKWVLKPAVVQDGEEVAAAVADVRLSGHRLFGLPLRAPALSPQPQEGRQARHAARAACPVERRTAADGDPRPAEGTPLTSSRRGRASGPTPPPREPFKEGSLLCCALLCFAVLCFVG